MAAYQNIMLTSYNCTTTSELNNADTYNNTITIKLSYRILQMYTEQINSSYSKINNRMVFYVQKNDKITTFSKETEKN